MKKMFLAIAIAALTSITAYAAKPVSEDQINMQATDAQAEAFASAPAAAAASTGYRFVSICGVLSTTVCPYGPNPIYFGTGANWTLAQCVSAWYVISRGPFGAWPRVLSNCAIF